MFAPVEGHILIDLVEGRDGIELLTIPTIASSSARLYTFDAEFYGVLSSSSLVLPEYTAGNAARSTD
jgi:hypothetical protein